MFHDETTSFPYNVLKLGCYLGPRIDVDLAMTIKFLTQDGEVLHRSMYRPSTQAEISDKDGTDAQEQFISRVHEKLGSWVL